MVLNVHRNRKAYDRTGTAATVVVVVAVAAVGK